MAKRYNRDHIEIFHDYGLHIPTRTISLDSSDGNSVDYEMTTRAIKNLSILANLSKDPITVILNTEGGDCYQGMAIYDEIKSMHDIHVTAIVKGAAQSMGCIVLQAADHRILMPSASLMYHNGSGRGPEANSYERLNAETYDHNYGLNICDLAIYNRMLEKNPKLSLKKFREDCLRSRWLFAEEAVALGLADEVKK